MTTLKEKAVKSKVLKITPHASRFTHMNQTDQFNVKCGDLTPDFQAPQTFPRIFKSFLKKDKLFKTVITLEGNGKYSN